MRRVVTGLLSKRSAWSRARELRLLLAQAAQLFERDVLGNIQIEDLEKGLYSWHRDLATYPDDGTEHPDDGIFLKHPGDITDPSIAKYGVPPDDKIYIQVRLHTKREFIARQLYQPAFDEFFQVMDELRRLEDQRIAELIRELQQHRPDLRIVGHKAKDTVMRVMVYRGARPDGSGLGGKYHTDKNDVTDHLWNSVSGLMLKPEELAELVPTRDGYSLWFVSDRLAKRLNVKPLLHGAQYAQFRKVIVAFIYFQYADELQAA